MFAERRSSTAARPSCKKTADDARGRSRRPADGRARDAARRRPRARCRAASRSPSAPTSRSARSSRRARTSRCKSMGESFAGTLRRLSLPGQSDGDQRHAARRQAVRPEVARRQGGARRLLGHLVRPLRGRDSQRARAVREVPRQGLRGGRHQPRRRPRGAREVRRPSRRFPGRSSTRSRRARAGGIRWPRSTASAASPGDPHRPRRQRDHAQRPRREARRASSASSSRTPG